MQLKLRSVVKTEENPHPLKKEVARFADGRPDYRDGAEGAIIWIEENVYVSIYPFDENGIKSAISVWWRIGELPDTLHPITKKSYRYMWEEQKDILREALKTDASGEFFYRLIVLCWMRGEGKSLVVCLIILWKFFNWPRQQMVLGANSKDQVKFVHFDIIRDIILNSPNLLAAVGGKANVREKEIRMKDNKGNVKSIIRAISSFSGIVSNITVYSFSEIFDMKNPKFFTQLDGSIRNIPNAFGLIDSTVSNKLHILYQLYQNTVKGKTKKVFFSYRSSKRAHPDDYWNPHMDEGQLADYQAKFPFGEFEAYFQNLWDAGHLRIFTEDMVTEIGIIGANNGLLNRDVIVPKVKRIVKLQEQIGVLLQKGFTDDILKLEMEVAELQNELTPVDSIYTLTDVFGQNGAASIEDLNTLGKMFDTDWAILAGTDFGDPYAVSGLARSVLVLVAKGLPGSKTNPMLGISLDEEAAPKYIYFRLLLQVVPSHSLDAVKTVLDQLHTEYGGIDTYCSERYGAWDSASWCEERDIKFEPIYPNYDKQRAAIKVYLEAIKEGRWKCPEVHVPGSRTDNIYREELSAFDHDSHKKWFGSNEKFEKHGIQDDVIFSDIWAIYGGRELGVNDFKSRGGTPDFGIYMKASGNVGRY